MTTTTFDTIPLHLITASLTNPRKTFHPGKLQELADSIAAGGVHQPVLVRPLPPERLQDTFANRIVGEHLAVYELVCGERRFRASQMAKQATIPAMIRPLTDAQVLEIQLLENLQRDDLHAMEEAEGYQALCDATGTEWHWKQLASACAISLSIDAKGVVRGLMGHFTHIDNTLATIKARATKTGAWRPTALYFNELDAIKDLVELHEFQIRKLSHAEYIAAAQHAVAEVIRTGGEVIEDAKTMQRSEQQLQRAGVWA